MNGSILRQEIEVLEARIAPATFTVTTLKDITNSGHTTGSLRDAIINADASTDATNSILFDVHGAITLTSALPAISLQAGSSLMIDGPSSGKPAGIVINGNSQQIFSILSGAVTIQDMTVTGGKAGLHGSDYVRGGGLYINDGSAVQLTDLIVAGNRATGASSYSIPVDGGEGGGIFIATGSNVTISKSVITGNRAAITADFSTSSEGGGIMCLGTLTLQNSTVSDNLVAGTTPFDAPGASGGSARGGGIYATKTANITITNSTISGNIAIAGSGTPGSFSLAGEKGVINSSGGSGGIAAGGGIYSTGGTVSIAGSTVSGNLAQGGFGAPGNPLAPYAYNQAGNGGSATGGGVAISSGGSLTVHGSTFTANRAQAGSGGQGFPTLPFFPVGKSGTGGSAIGGGISVTGGGSLVLQMSKVSGNQNIDGSGSVNGADYGGGVYVHGTLNAYEVTVANNSAFRGGGIYLAGSGTVLGATLFGNTAHRGAGIQVGQNTTFTLQNSTLALNVAINGGGGIAIAGGSTVNIHNDTIADNSVSAAVGVGGGVDIPTAGATVSIISTIIAQNSAPHSADLFSVNAAAATLNFDLIEATPTAGSYTNAGNNIFSENPLLGALAHNGGPTLTMLPGIHSPVINTGFNPDSLLTDQRGVGFARTVGVGIGASDGTDIGAIELQ
jgi:hypothetical protein